MIFNSQQESDLLNSFITHVGEERLNSFREYEHRPQQLSNQELFVLFNFQQYQIANRAGNPDAEETLGSIHQNIQQMNQYQTGRLTSPLTDSEWQVWSNYANSWINSMYWFNRFLSKLCDNGVLTESEADNLLLVRYFTGLYYEVGANAYNASKLSLGDAYREGSEWYDQLNMNMTNLSLNLQQVFAKRGEMYSESHQRFVHIKLEIVGLALEELRKKFQDSNFSESPETMTSMQPLADTTKLFLKEVYRDAHGATDAVTLNESDISAATGLAASTSPTEELPEGISQAFFLGFVALTELEKAHNTEVSYFA